MATGWSRVFLIGACVYLTGNTVFLVLGRADVQPWNNPDRADKGEKLEKGNGGADSELQKSETWTTVTHFVKGGCSCTLRRIR